MNRFARATQGEQKLLNAQNLIWGGGLDHARNIDDAPHKQNFTRALRQRRRRLHTTNTFLFGAMHAWRLGCCLLSASLSVAPAFRLLLLLFRSKRAFEQFCSAK